MIERELIVSINSFFGMLNSLVMSGVTFKAEQIDENNIKIYFTGGY